jgi:uncharacterized membrane protein HdeD (DUF308 family)
MVASHGSKASHQHAAADAHPLSTAIAQHWWAIAIRGALGILFGLVAFAFPGVTMLSLVYLFGVYAIVDGVFAIISAFRAARSHRHWGLLVVEGAAGILAGAIAWLWPGISLTAFVWLVGAWAVVTGALMFRSAFALHLSHGRWWLVLGGVASMVFGAMLIAAPLVGALVLTWWIGIYATIFGASLLMLALRLRARKHEQPAHAHA